MGRAVVDNPEHATSIVVRWPGHYLLDQAVKGLDAVLRFAATKDPGMVDIQSRNISPGPAAKVLVLDLHSGPRAAGASGVFALPCLDSGFLVGRDHELIIFQRFTFPFTGIQIQQAAGLVGEVGITWEDATTVVPGPNGVPMPPAPKGAAIDGSHQAFLTGFAGQVRSAPAGQWQAVRGREFASPGLHLHDQIRGKKSGDDPDESVLLNRRGVRGKTACAKNRRLHGTCPNGRRSGRWPSLRRPEESSWRAAPEDTVTYICRHVSRVELTRS